LKHFVFIQHDDYRETVVVDMVHHHLVLVRLPIRMVANVQADEYFRRNQPAMVSVVDRYAPVHVHYRTQMMVCRLPLHFLLRLRNAMALVFRLQPTDDFRISVVLVLPY
jgi:hypothetical protein